MKTKLEQRDRRRKRIRAKLFGTAEKPRFSVFKSNKYISAQLIDDSKGVTLVSGTTKTIKAKNMQEKAKILGGEIGKSALAKKISLAIFDRGGYLYVGSLAALADGAREAGLKF
jgi:large subunit ribosomal protein L18